MRQQKKHKHISNGHKLSFRCSHFTHFIRSCSLTFMCGPFFCFLFDVFYCCKKAETAHSCVNLNLFEIHMPICIFFLVYLFLNLPNIFISFAMWTWIIRKSRCEMVAASWMKATKCDGITVFLLLHKCLISLCAFLLFTVTFSAVDNFLCRHFSHCCRAKSINNTWTWQKHVFSGSNQMHHRMSAVPAGCRTMWNILSTLNYDDCWKGRIINTHGTICYRCFFVVVILFLLWNHESKWRR